MGSFNVRIAVDLDRREASLAAVDVPFNLSRIADQLPSFLAPMATWLGDDGVQDAGASIVATGPVISLYADVGPLHQAPAGRVAIVRAAGESAFALALPGMADLGETPLFGHLLTGLSIGNLRALYFGPNDWPKEGVTLPTAVDWAKFLDHKKGVSLDVDLSSSSGTSAASLNFDPSKQPPRAAALVRATPMAAPSAASGSDIQWMDLGQTIGPLTIGRIGFGTGTGLTVGLDASLKTSVLSVDLTGFTLTIPDGHGTTFHVALDGLAVDFSSGSVALAGSLVRTALKDGYEYDGSLLLKAGPYALAAVGSYAEVDGVDSLFVYGVMAGTFGGPPAFVVTGLAAGFGVNRNLRLPDPDKVLDFPLIAAAVAATGTTKSSSGPGQTKDALLSLNKGGWVPIEHGEYWLAIGVAFRSFEIVEGFALLSVSFGNELTVALLGVGTMQLPTDEPEKLAYVELTLDAVFRPAEGTFSLIALLTDRSYVLAPACKLTGGFATCVWFPPNEHAGDFVVTLGGYHPSFHCDWYPTIPRLGFDWKVSTLVELTGGAYFALTPKCVMAGGYLSLTFEDGALAAWFKASADFIVYWQPFNYSADLSISIGASYDANWGVIHHKFVIELGADLSLWGPPFAGVAHVHWFVISFTITINGAAQQSAVVLPDWATFADASLPGVTTGGTSLGALAAPDHDKPADKPTKAFDICRPRVAQGLVSTSTDASGVEWWHLSTDGLVLSVETAIPVTNGLSLSAQGPQVNDGPSQAWTPVSITAPAVNVAQLGSYPLQSTLKVTLEDPKGNTHDLATDWTWAPTTGKAPAALWGAGNKRIPPRDPPVPSADEMTVPAVVAVVGTAPAAERPAGYAANTTAKDVGDRALPFPVVSARPQPVDGRPAPRTTAAEAREAKREEPVTPQLRAVCRRPGDSGRWHVEGADGSGAPAGGLPAGATAVYAVDTCRPAAVDVAGSAHVSVGTIAPDGAIAMRTMAPGDSHVVPAGSAWLVATALDRVGRDRPLGWDRERSRLVQVDDHSFAGDGIVVATQGPVRHFGRRPRFAHPAIDAARIVEDNLCRTAQGERSGFVATAFPDGVAHVAVIVDGDSTPPFVALVPAGVYEPLTALDGHALGGLDSLESTLWWYPAPAGAGFTLVARAAPGGRLRSVIGVDGAHVRGAAVPALVPIAPSAEHRAEVRVA